MNKTDQYFATDKDIHDLLYSAKQRITENVLHELSRDRGIFYSHKESRETLSNKISLLSHDYNDVIGIIERRDSSRRNERTTSITLNINLTPEEIKDAINEYRQTTPNEVVTSFQKSTTEVNLNITYDEYDYSKTRLIQRQQKEASIEFLQKDGKTFIRIPATEKARVIVEDLKNKISSKKKQEIPSEEIELSALTQAEERTTFFMKLIRSLPNYNLLTVSKLRVATSTSTSTSGADDEIDIEEDDNSDASSEMLSIVKHIALSGENLMASPIYQDLKDRGYFITSITWRCKQTAEPYTVMQFEAGFEDRQQAKKFRYGITGALRHQNGAYTKTLRPVTASEKEGLFDVIEEAARSVLNELITAKNVTTITPALKATQ